MCDFRFQICHVQSEVTHAKLMPAPKSQIVNRKSSIANHKFLLGNNFCTICVDYLRGPFYVP